jgi:hypothetical protein
MKYTFGDKVMVHFNGAVEFRGIVLSTDSPRQLYYVRTESDGSGWVAPASVRAGWDEEAPKEGVQ